jgi:hypothetical protein
MTVYVVFDDDVPGGEPVAVYATREAAQQHAATEPWTSVKPMDVLDRYEAR